MAKPEEPNVIDKENISDDKPSEKANSSSKPSKKKHTSKTKTGEGSAEKHSKPLESKKKESFKKKESRPDSKSTKSEDPSPLPKADTSKESTNDSTIPPEFKKKNAPKKKPHYSSKEELLAMVYECQTMDLSPLSANALDPLERAVRTVVPIPNVYYWEVVDNPQDEEDIPIAIKFWHNTIATAAYMGIWFDTNVTQPLAATVTSWTSSYYYSSNNNQYMLEQDELNDESEQSIQEHIKKVQA